MAMRGWQKFFMALGVLLLVALLGAAALRWWVTRRPSEFTLRHDGVRSARPFDHEHRAWSILLGRFVRGGLVDYARWKREGANGLSGYLASLQSVSGAEYARWSKAQRLAYWLNLYNASTVSLVLRHYPVRSIREIGVLPLAAFRESFIRLPRLAGASLSLDEVEHGIIRAKFKEPRVHFALVCASRGCPPLRRVAYRGSDLAQQLETAAREFLGDETKNRFDPKRRTLFLSPIFKWFRTDFAATRAEVLVFLRRYLPRLPTGGRRFRIRHLRYDWALNDDAGGKPRWKRAHASASKPHPGSATHPYQVPRRGRLRTPDGVSLFYQVVGDGADTVIVPLAYFLADDLAPLAKGRRVIFYDLRGRGRSEAVNEPKQLGIEKDISDLETVRRHFRVQRPALIGFSYLGAVVALYAQRYPSHVARLVQIGPMWPRAKAPYLKNRMATVASHADPAGVKEVEALEKAGVDRRDPIRHCRAYWKAHLPTYTATAAAAARLFSRLHLGCDLPNEQLRRLMRTLSHVLGVTKHDWRPQARAIRAPTLVLHGDQDHVAPLAGGREWAQLIPRARFLRVPQAGHLIWAEQPAVFFPAVRAFLRGTWPRASKRLPADR